MRLTVGRRLALVIAIAILTLITIVIVLLRANANDAQERTEDSLRGMTATLAATIEGELMAAASAVEVAAASGGEENAIVKALEDSGFIAAEVIASEGEASRLRATRNLIDRSMLDTTFGKTSRLNGRVGVIIGTPMPQGDTTADQVLIGAYDAATILESISTSRIGPSTEALLAVRNTAGDPVIFTPSRHGNDQPVGQPRDRVTSTLIENVLDGEGNYESGSQLINGRRSVVSMQRVPGVEWVVISATDVGDAGATTVPIWLVPAFLLVGGLMLIPVAMLRNRLRRLTTAADELSRDRLTTPLADSSDDEVGVLARALQGIDDRLEAEEGLRTQSAATLQHRATHDPLTGLANRARLVEELTVALNNREPVAVLFCDIDDFKGINDSQGHEGGDIVLKFVAEQLASACGPNDLIARFGGDEFCVLSHSGATAARQLAGKVERALDATCVVNGTQQRVGGSVGMAIAKITDTPDTILKSADLAMYREKERRRGLRRAAGGAGGDIEISPEQIRLVYQPVVELSDGAIVGVEVLARYMHPVLGMLDPSSFLPPGTERGEFDKFDLEILTRSIAQLSDWLSHGIVDERFTMSFNLKPDHVSDSDSTRQIFETLRQHRVPFSMLQIEVTEHRLHAHADDLIHSLHLLRERGIKVAIDDFGIEGSNVDRLVQIPSDTVKIDRSFVSEIDIDERAQARLKAILDIVKAEGRVPIVEGVERQRQADILRELDVPCAQGYLWHAPISALALTPLLGRASRWIRRKPNPTV